jgi:hypothetical protein
MDVSRERPLAPRLPPIPFFALFTVLLGLLISLVLWISLSISKCDLTQMLSRRAISKPEYARLKRMLRHEKLLAVQSVSCTCTVLEGNISIANPVTPDQLAAVYKVFNTAELLESILSCLSPVEPVI